MAQVSAYMSIDMIHLHAWYGTVIEATSSRIIVSDDHNISIYQGQGFRYSGQSVVGGTVTEYSQFYNGSLVAEAHGLSVPASIAAVHIQGDNLPALLRIALLGDDVIFGSAHDDRLAGYDGDDTIHSGGGHDIIDGGNGIDTAIFSGARSQHETNYQDTAGQVTRTDGTASATLYDIERIRFDDGTLALDITGNAGQAYRIYQAAFDRTPDASGLSYWIDRMDDGLSLMEVASGFLHSDEFRSAYGTDLGNGEFVDRLYRNILDRDGEASGFDYWVDRLDSGASREFVLASFSESDENILGVMPEIGNGIWLG